MRRRVLRRVPFVALMSLLTGLCHTSAAAMADPGSHVAGTSVVHVSPDGDDRNPGTNSAPFRTMERAQQALTALRKRGNAEVMLHDGTYRLTEPLTVTPDGGKVSYRAMPGAHPVITGGRLVTGWQPAGNGIWRAPAPGLDTRQLYVDGVRAVRARSVGNDLKLTPTAEGYYTSNTKLHDWPDAPGLEVVDSVQWKQYRCPVASVAPSEAGSLLARSSADSSLMPDQGPDNALDGSMETFWSSASSGGPHLLETSLTTAKTVAKAVIRTRALPDLRITAITVSTGVSGGALTVRSTVTGNKHQDVSAVFDRPVKADRIRVTVDEATYRGSPRQNAEIAEVSLYGADGQLIDTRPAGTQVTMAQPCWSNSHLFGEPAVEMGTPSWLENSLQLLDLPGEWYLDKDAGYIYYRPRTGEDLTRDRVEAPVLQTLLEAVGKAGHPVLGVALHGITFAFTTWLGPNSDEGYADLQSGQHVTGPHTAPVADRHSKPGSTPAAVTASYVHNVAVTDCAFTHLGTAALSLGTGTQSGRVFDNHVDDVSGSGIQIGGVLPVDHHPTTADSITRDLRIHENVITRIGREYADGVGVFVGYTDHVVIEHNKISQVPYSGISLGWGWGMTDPGGHPAMYPDNKGWPVYQTPTTARRNVIAHNLIADFMRELDDGGAIYVLGAQGRSLSDGLVIEGNVAHGQVGAGNTIYTDAGSRYVTILGNALWGNRARGVWGGDWGGCFPRGDLTYISNYWAQPNKEWNCVPEQSAVSRVIFNDNHNITGPESVPARLLAAAGPSSRDSSAVMTAR